MYYLYHLQSSTKIFFITGTSHWATHSSGKSISGVNFVDKMPLLDTYDLSDILSFFFLSECNTFNMVSCIFKHNFLIVLIPCYPWYLFPSLNWVIKLTLNCRTVSYNEIVKRCIPRNNLFCTTWPCYWVYWFISILFQSYHTI